MAVYSVLLALWGAAAAVAVGTVVVWWRRRRARRLPEIWPLAGRKVFSTHEEQLYGLLRAAFPDLAVLSKLPLTRFMRLTAKKNAEFWFDLVSPLYVSFAVCLPNGRVLTVIDCERANAPASRSAQSLKRRALRSCHIRYVRIDDGVIPTIKALRQMVLGAAESAYYEGPQSVRSAELATARQHLEKAVQGRRTERDVWYRDSIVNKDSFLRRDSHAPVEPDIPV
ncbi:MAG: DUF2726 domain-containing protein [Betaproteobacteria bacterium]|nr:DUF2726 domain-containing protein [Betaproteobacteria bacterium]MDE2047181.1 DUF2726 domain-containing protein [Betaproteobacteria bacterium]